MEVAGAAGHALNAAMDKGLSEADQAVIFYLMQDGTVPAPRVVKPLVRSMPAIPKAPGASSHTLRSRMTTPGLVLILVARAQGHDFDKALGLQDQPKHSPFPGPKDQPPSEFSIPAHRWQR